MKKILSIVLLLICFLTVFVACEKEQQPDVPGTPDTPVTPNNPETPINPDDGSGSVADNTEHFDDITRSFKLNKDYEGKSFLTDGIGQATVVAYTDGDTTRFKLTPSNETVIIRYYGVDTPESTGDIEKWGKAASNFTKQQLSTAEEFVLEATAERAVHDTYGVRYLGYVWYRPTGETEFKCLNLELVENGYTDYTGVDTSEYPYHSYFAQANKHAKSIKLRVYSDLDDPNYTDEPVITTLVDLVENMEDNYYFPDVDAGIKVRFEGVLTRLYISQSGTYTFTATYYDVETGKKYEIDVYAGYSSSGAHAMKLGHLYRIVGTVAKHSGKYQISGVTYSTTYGDKDESYTHPIVRNYYLTFDSTISYVNQMSQTYYGNVTVTSAQVEDDGTTLKVVGTASKWSKDGLKAETETFTFKIANGAVNIDKFTQGKQFSVAGYQYEEGVITIHDYNSIKLK